MKLLLERRATADGATIGELFVDGVFECFTLEDAVREIPGQPVSTWKIPGETAIPRGEYPISITYSNRFKRNMPLLESVPGFAGIRIHAGNTSEDTEGCLLVGRTAAAKTVGESRAAYAVLYGKIQAAIDAGDSVRIEIV